MAEKKEVHAIAHSMRETKRSKANEAFEVVAKFLSLGALNRVLYPLQQAVLACSSQKTLRKLEVRLRKKPTNTWQRNLVARAFSVEMWNFISPCCFTGGAQARGSRSVDKRVALSCCAALSHSWRGGWRAG